MRVFLLIILLSTLSPACGPGVSPYHLPDGDSDGTTDGVSDGQDGASDPGDPADSWDGGGDGEPDGDDGLASDGDGDLDSRCTGSEVRLDCAHHTLDLETGPNGSTTRQVHYQLPLGQPPAEGWPVALFFQGSLFSAQNTWTGIVGEVFGIFHQVASFCALLDAGVAVLAPETHLQGTTFWDSNLPAYALDWQSAPDHYFVQSILAAVESGQFGPLNGDKMFAFGFSSGGYMASRVGIAYPGRFRALAIHSGSYATCAGAVCSVPNDLPSDHLPVLFLHGSLDATVPEWTMRLYQSALSDMGVETRVDSDALAGHQWLESAPRSIVDWFDLYR